MTDNINTRAVKLYDDLMKALEDDKKYSRMSNAELARKLIILWGELPLFSHSSNLLDEVILRLSGVRGEK